MSFEKVKAFFAAHGMAERIREFDVSSATVELAAAALRCDSCRIAKTLAFLAGERTILIVAAGDARIDNRKYRERFGVKAKMIPPAEVETRTGHVPGGVCPFVAATGTEIYLDLSLKRFETVFPACGSSNSAIELTLPELERCSGAKAWVEVCRLRE